MTDVVLAGVGGQGILTLAHGLTRAAHAEGKSVVQSEVHGMSQRGGAVVAHVRIHDEAPTNAQIPQGSADLILAMEPMEALRYLDRLAPHGRIVAAEEPFENIPVYPDLDAVRAAVLAIDGSRLVPTQRIAREAGDPRATNVALLGAASHHLPFSEQTWLTVLGDMFASKGDKAVEANRNAFKAGRALGLLHA